MKLCTSHLLVILSLSLARHVFGQEGAATEPPTGEGTSMMVRTPFCASSLDMIKAEISRQWSAAEDTVYFNCLAFGRERALESGIVSVFPNNGVTPGTRFTLTCREDILLIAESAQPARRFNLTAQNFQACAECIDASAVNDICPLDRRCPPECDRCFEFAPDVLTCTECVRYRLLNEYRLGAVLTPEQIEDERARLEANGQEEVCRDDPIPDPTIGTSFSCVQECPDGGNTSRVSPSGTCYSCGIEYCVQCEPAEEGGTARDECIQCLDGTIHFDGSCFSCPLALVARLGILQEAEEQEEIAVQRMRQIELAVSLPIVSLIVIAFFISMSIYAHHRYPHTGYDGKGDGKGHPRDPFNAASTANLTSTSVTGAESGWRQPSTRH